MKHTNGMPLALIVSYMPMHFLQTLCENIILTFFAFYFTHIYANWSGIFDAHLFRLRFKNPYFCSMGCESGEGSDGGAW